MRFILLRCFTSFVFMLSSDCRCSVCLPLGADDWSVTCDGAISWSYSYAFYVVFAETNMLSYNIYSEEKV